MFDTALVNLYTHDIEAGIRFYRDLLGFTETRVPTSEDRTRRAVDKVLGAPFAGLAMA